MKMDTTDRRSAVRFAFPSRDLSVRGEGGLDPIFGLLASGLNDRIVCLLFGVDKSDQNYFVSQNLRDFSHQGLAGVFFVGHSL